MAKVRVTVNSIDKDSFPGIVEFALIEFSGESHLFSEKIPVTGIAVQDTPFEAWIDCVVLNEGLKTISISTENPHGIESEEGCFQFEVPFESIKPG